MGRNYLYCGRAYKQQLHIFHRIDINQFTCKITAALQTMCAGHADREFWLRAQKWSDQNWKTTSKTVNELILTEDGNSKYPHRQDDKTRLVEPFQDLVKWRRCDVKSGKSSPTKFAILTHSGVSSILAEFSAKLTQSILPICTKSKSTNRSTQATEFLHRVTRHPENIEQNE